MVNLPTQPWMLNPAGFGGQQQQMAPQGGHQPQGAMQGPGQHMRQRGGDIRALIEQWRNSRPQRPEDAQRGMGWGRSPEMMAWRQQRPTF